MNRESVQEWINYANEDLEGGKLLFRNSPEKFKTLVCFHMQQSVEKYLKAYLVANNIDIEPDRKDHSMAKLVEWSKECDKTFNVLYDLNITKLTKYAVRSRYPGSEPPTLEDEKEAISIAEQVRPFVLDKIKDISTNKTHDKEPDKNPTDTDIDFR